MPPWDDAGGNPFGEAPKKLRERALSSTEPAGWWHRVAGWIIDASLAMAAGAGVAAWASSAGRGDDDAQALGAAAGFLAWLLNVVVLVTITRGQSLGKLVGGMRLVREDGGRVGAWLCFLRDVLLRLLYLIPLFFLLDSLWPLSSGGQTLRDKIANTRVLQAQGYGRRSAALVLAAVGAFFVMGLAISATPDRWGDDTLDYGPQARRDYITACRRDMQFTTSECACSYTYLRKRVPYSQFERLVYEDTPEPSARSNRIWERMLDRCLGDSDPGYEPPKVRA